MCMNRVCPECQNLSISLVRCLFSDKWIRCSNCGASFDLKNTLLNKVNIGFWSALMFSGVLLLLLLYKWKIIAVLALFSVLYFPFHKAKYGKLELTGLRARLKNAGVDTEKTDNAKK